MFPSLFASLALVALALTATAAPASLAERVAQARAMVLGLDGSPLPDTVRLQREWKKGVLTSTVRNTGKAPVRVGSVVLAEFEHGLPPSTPVYGEGFTMLSQTGGTLGGPADEGFYTDRDHYKIPEPRGRRTVYGVLTVQASPVHRWLLGFTSTDRFVGRLSFDATTISISVDTEGLELAPGRSWRLESLWVGEGPDQGALFHDLAKQLKRTYRPALRSPSPTGWCSWYCFGPSVTAAQIRGNLGWAREHAPDLRYIQIDDGYQPWMGDWLEPGRSFGGDMRSVLGEIKQEGFEPAIWVAPFVASPQSKLFKEHPEWFVMDNEGKPLRSDRIGFGGWRLGPWYVLDGTHPAALQWLEQLFRTMRKDWGCTYFKLDATYWGAMHGGVHHDRQATRVEAYRRGMAAIRRGAGDAFILGCNHPMWPSIGLVDGSRSSMDVSREWHYFAKTGRENLLRAWQNGWLWWNDPDTVCLNGLVMREKAGGAGALESIGKASDDEFLFHATLVRATGGMLLVGDDMRTYGQRELERLRSLIPNRVAMKFDDAFRVGRASTPQGEQVALLNWRETPDSVAVALDGRVRIREVWSGTDLGVHEGTFVWTNLPPHAGRLLELRRARR